MYSVVFSYGNFKSDVLNFCNLELNSESSTLDGCLSGSITGIGYPLYLEEMLTFGVYIMKTQPIDIMVSPFEQLTLNPYL